MSIFECILFKNIFLKVVVKVLQILVLIYSGIMVVWGLSDFINDYPNNLTFIIHITEKKLTLMKKKFTNLRHFNRQFALFYHN